jgi:hypothetical protein
MAAHRLKAPSDDGGVLAEPPLSAAGILLARNRDCLARLTVDILGQPLVELRSQARQLAALAIRDYHRWAGEPLPPFDASAPLFLAGHQPELFHPGVWVKNFALCGLARRHQASALHLVVDNDTLKTAGIKLPTLADSSPGPTSPPVRLLTVPFDRWEGETPYEERTVHDEVLFADFAERVMAGLRGLGLTPLLPEFWAEVRRQSSRTPLLGERFAAARRSLERSWGCVNAELPVSAMCQMRPFAWFAAHLLLNLPRFQTVYNDCVREYRRAHGIRSRNHPVPDLVRDGDWLEAPFWAWRPGQTKRSRLLVRLAGAKLELRTGEAPGPALPAEPRAILEGWQQLDAHGYKVRSRALTTTLFARLFLADLFIHGIGGGKYDELTDEIARRFYLLEPPGYLVLSATLRLPLPTYPADPERCRRLARLLRDLRYNPQRHLNPHDRTQPALARLLEQKEDWINREPVEPGAKRERFLVLRQLTDQLHVAVAEHERTVARDLALCEALVQANAVLRRRDFAFCLFPEAELRPFYERFLALGD